MNKPVELEICGSRKKSNEKTKEYCEGSRFTCLLGEGADPKATIYNLRAMAHFCGWESGVRDLMDHIFDLLMTREITLDSPISTLLDRLSKYTKDYQNEADMA